MKTQVLDSYSHVKKAVRRKCPLGARCAPTKYDVFCCIYINTSCEPLHFYGIFCILFSLILPDLALNLWPLYLWKGRVYFILCIPVVMATHRGYLFCICFCHRKDLDVSMLSCPERSGECFCQLFVVFVGLVESFYNLCVKL